jgi:hypothetical protein
MFPASGQTNRERKYGPESPCADKLRPRSVSFFSFVDPNALRPHKNTGFYIYARRVLSRAQFFHDFANAEPSKIL